MTFDTALPITEVVSGHYSQLVKHQRFSENYNDLHTRPFTVAETPLRISHISFLHGDKSSYESEQKHLQALCDRYSINPPKLGDTCFYQSFGEFEVRWERHTEFSTYSFTIYGEDSKPFEHPPVSLIPTDWLQLIPGEVISALHVEVLDNGASIQIPDKKTPDKEALRQYFEGQRLIGSELRNGAATIWSALRLHRDGFNRILLLNSSLNECQTGRVLRALLELEGYRNMMLLAFPEAQQVSMQVSKMEAQLARLVRQISGERIVDEEQRQLAELSDLAAAIAELIARSRYRFDAGQAYYQMVQSRLGELEENEINGLQTLSAFVDRRLSPALRTVEAAKRRLDDLASRVDRASDFLRTRIDMAIEAQNQTLLKSMDRRAQMQFRLQQTVEGLSVVVITYYVMGLMHYLFDAAHTFGLHFSSERTIAVMVPVVMLTTWILSRRMHKRISRTQ
ncbi:MAG: DUF3422 domain-containing protein [Amphritea sp.]|nr:DUF3422 domain-containing protein [Amphritea sp.]MBQ0784261.1 DUF3422 domain-containing protein [Amphritea sp.]